jgi:hypothetical protein
MDRRDFLSASAMLAAASAVPAARGGAPPAR